MVNTRSTYQLLSDLNPEIERTFLRNQREARSETETGIMETDEDNRTPEQRTLADTQRQLAQLQLVVDAQRALMEAQ